MSQRETHSPVQEPNAHSRFGTSSSLWPQGLHPSRLLCPWDFPERRLEQAAISFSRGFSWRRDRTHASCIGMWIPYHGATREAQAMLLSPHTFGEGRGTHPSPLTWKPHGQKSLVGYSPWNHKESDTTEWLSMHISAKFTPQDIHLFKYVSSGDVQMEIKYSE